MYIQNHLKMEPHLNTKCHQPSQIERCSVFEPYFIFFFLRNGEKLPGFTFQNVSEMVKAIHWFFNIWIPKYIGDLHPELVWYSNGQKEVQCQMVWYSDALWIPHIPTIWRQWGQNDARHLVFLCTGLVFKWLASYIEHST